MKQRFMKKLQKLNKLNIKFVVHIIIGLPKEENDDYLKQLFFTKLWNLGIKTSSYVCC